MSEGAVRRFEEITARWREAVDAGLLDQARTLAEEALAVAEESQEPPLVRRARCNRAQILIELGEGDSVLGVLRGLLTESREPDTTFHSAYALARAYDLKGDRAKALFYARIAQGHALTATNPEFVCWAHNLLGCIYLGESHFEKALHEFEAALAAGASPVREALVRDNLGYCLVVLGRIPEGLPHLYRSVRVLRRLCPAFARLPHLALSVAFLDLNRLQRATRHGRAALHSADAEGDREAAKMALYLLGEVAKQAGDYSLARSYFGVLQTRYYPENSRLADVLLTVDTRQLVNLKAQR